MTDGQIRHASNPLSRNQTQYSRMPHRTTEPAGSAASAERMALISPQPAPFHWTQALASQAAARRNIRSGWCPSAARKAGVSGIGVGMGATRPAGPIKPMISAFGVFPDALGQVPCSLGRTLIRLSFQSKRLHNASIHGCFGRILTVKSNALSLWRLGGRRLIPRWLIRHWSLTWSVLRRGLLLLLSSSIIRRKADRDYLIAGRNIRQVPDNSRLHCLEQRLLLIAGQLDVTKVHAEMSHSRTHKSHNKPPCDDGSYFTLTPIERSGNEVRVVVCGSKVSSSPAFLLSVHLLGRLFGRMLSPFRTGPAEAVSRLFQALPSAVSPAVLAHLSRYTRRIVLSNGRRELGYRELPARPRHHSQADGAIDVFKKVSPHAWTRSRTSEASIAAI